MGVALALAETTDEARHIAREAADKVRIRYNG
jgi:formate-dependent phosphoribosylglycinamide formyltransferase (GAR transformylase)